jgi:cytochrome P450
VTESETLDRDRLRELFDLRSSYNVHSGGDYVDDPYPVWRDLRERAPVHPGTVHDLTGYPGDAFFQGLPYPDRPHFSAFTYAACGDAYKDDEVFASSPEPVDTDDIGVGSSMLSMGGAQHWRYRTLVQPSFVRSQAEWWISRWIERTVHGLIDGSRATAAPSSTSTSAPPSPCSRSPAASPCRSSRLSSSARR